MRRFFAVLLLALASVAGCAPDECRLRPREGEPRGPQNKNRMLINRSTDLFGV
jgi:hypothetical protein